MKKTLDNIVDRMKIFTLDSLIEQVIYRISKNPPIQQPWVLLSFLEIAYRECDNNFLKFKANYQEFSNICQKLFELMDSHPFSDFNKYLPNKIFHVLAYQQFPYQTIFDKKDIQRQYFLFNAENYNSRLNSNMRNEYGFTVSEFLKLWEDIIINETKDAKDNSSQLTAPKLLGKFTIEHGQISNKIQAYSNGIGNDFYKTFSTDFFVKYPFIQYKNCLFCIDLRLFTRTLNEFLFERVLEWQDTKANFDERFQQYVDFTLKKIKVHYKNEQELKLDGHQECDFLIEDFLFAECKAIKLKPLAQVYPDDTTLKNKLAHILKAYKQIISTANRHKQSEYFGVIITFLPFYFPDCNTIWHLIEEDIQKYVKENNIDLLIEPSNIFFIDIKSWDKLIDYKLTTPNKTIKEIFQDAYESNKKKPKLEFGMHLNK